MPLQLVSPAKIPAISIIIATQLTYIFFIYKNNNNNFIAILTLTVIIWSGIAVRCSIVILPPMNVISSCVEIIYRYNTSQHILLLNSSYNYDLTYL